MKNRVGLLLLLVTVAVAGVFAAPPRTASAEIEVRSNTAQNRFPSGIQFSLFLNSGGANITDVRLRYRILPDGVNATVRPNCTQGSATCNATVGNTAQVYMVPGAEVVYSWEVTDDQGGRVITPEQTVVYADDRFDWEETREGNLIVYSYFGDSSSVLRTAQETITSLSTLLRTTVDYPVKIWVYRTAQEMSPAVASRRGQGPNTSIQTLGEVGASDTALVSRDTDFLNIVRHELAHIVTRAATRSHITEIPVWINEGLSVYAQTALLQDEEAALRIAIQRNRLLPITSLAASARGSSDAVSLFYAQSGAIVSYMIKTYGEAKFADFVAALARDTTDGAMKQVYGFDQVGLENEWRKSLGLPEVGASGGQQAGPTAAPQGSGRQNPTPVNGGQQSQNQNPTPAPNRNPQQAANDSDGGGISLITVAAILSAIVVILVAAAAGLLIQDRRRARS